MSATDRSVILDKESEGFTVSKHLGTSDADR